MAYHECLVYALEHLRFELELCLYMATTIPSIISEPSLMDEHEHLPI
jgi:hypothetical protein